MAKHARCMTYCLIPRINLKDFNLGFIRVLNLAALPFLYLKAGLFCSDPASIGESNKTVTFPQGAIQKNLNNVFIFIEID